MSKTTVTVAYDGAAAQGTMDVQELAPALLAIGELLQSANHILNGDRARVRVNVKSDFHTGSFEITLDVVQSLSDQIKFLMGHDGPYSAADIVNFVGLSAATSISLIKALKWLRGRNIKKVTVIENGNCRIETEGEYDSIEVSEEIVQLYRSKRVRQGVKDTLSPLKKEGIDRFLVRDKGSEVQEINKNETSFFEVPDIPEEELLDSTANVVCEVVGVFFEEGPKWRLFDGDNRINAAIKDQEFLKALDQGQVSFSKGDLLEVELRTRQWKTEKGLRKEHEVLKVIKQHKALEQLPLAFEMSSEAD